VQLDPILIVEVVIGVGFLILIHELGHFAAAKLLGVRVLKFSLGFGKTLVGFQRGETEYVISALPLGGYVKMVGENPGEQETPDPHALSNQAAWRRAIIFVSGVVMNVIGGFVLFVVAFQIGVPFPTNMVGEVTAGPALRAGIREGDRIVEVNGRATSDFEDVSAVVAFSNPNRDLTVKVRRDDQVLTFRMRPQTDEAANPGFPTIGIRPEGSTIIEEVLAGSAGAEAGLARGDQIVAVKIADQSDVLVQTLSELKAVLLRAKDAPMTLTVQDRHGLVRRQEVRQRPVEMEGLPWDVGRPVIQAVAGGSPAETGGLRPGDVLLKADDASITSVRALTDAIAAAGERVLAVTVRRGEEEVEVRVIPRTVRASEGPKIGVVLGVPAEAAPTLLAVKPGTALAKMDLPLGATVVNVNKTAVKTVGEMHEALATVLDKAPRKSPVTVRVTFREPDGREVERELTTESDVLGYDLGVLPGVLSTREPIRNVFQACAKGWHKTVQTTRNVILSIGRMLFTRSIKGRTMSGPVGLVQIAYKQAETGLGRLLYLLAIIGVNLAIVNLLPIPILDGGQLLLLGVEKVKGSPISERTQALAQYVGLVLILMLFAYVTFHDVMRLIPAR
jgi:regulator of sigma E protease